MTEVQPSRFRNAPARTRVARPLAGQTSNLSRRAGERASRALTGHDPRPFHAPRDLANPFWTAAGPATHGQAETIAAAR